MKLLIFLGENYEYLGFKPFENDEDVDRFLEKLEPLMEANHAKKLPLKKRLELYEGEYFLYAGSVVDFEVEEL